MFEKFCGLSALPKSFIWDIYECLFPFNDAAVCVYISMLDGGLAALPESQMKA